MTPPDAPDGEFPPLLTLRSATLVRGGIAVLRDIDLTIRQGEHTAILGPNGSGKSSLIKLITREAYPLMLADGQPAVRLFGKAQWDVGELRSLLGIVTSDLHQTFTRQGAGVTAVDAVLSGFFGSVGLPPRAVVTGEMRERAQAALEELGVLALIQRPMEAVSTGEARRVLIARALVCQPRALLLDEPTTGLDLAAQHAFLEALRRVARGGVTLLLVTHHAEEIVPEVGRVVLLREGRVFRDGLKSDTLTGANLTALFGLPIALKCDTATGFYRTRVERVTR